MIEGGVGQGVVCPLGCMELNALSPELQPPNTEPRPKPSGGPRDPPVGHVAVQVVAAGQQRLAVGLAHRPLAARGRAHAHCEEG